jgi:TolA-binding protein
MPLSLVAQDGSARNQPPTTSVSQIAQDTEQLTELFRKAVADFGAGRFNECIDGLKSMLGKGVEGPGTENIYFTMASAWLNLGDFPQAKAGFEEYLRLFPTGSRSVDARIGRAETQARLGDSDGALKSFAELANNSAADSELILLRRANLLKEKGQISQAVALLLPLLNGALKSEKNVQLLFLMASLQLEIGEVDTAFRILKKIEARPDLVGNPLDLNVMWISVGDALLKRRSFKLALQAYNNVQRKQEVLNLQREKLQGMEQKCSSHSAILRESPNRFAVLQAENTALRSQIEQGKKVYEEVEKADDYLLALRLRQVRACQELGRNWEAVVLLESLAEVKGAESFRSDILYGLFVSHSELGNVLESDKAAEAYLREFPDSKNAETICFKQANQRSQKGDFAGAEILLTRVLQDSRDEGRQENALFLLGNARFSAAKYKEAQSSYLQHSERFPKSEYALEVQYRRALCYFFKSEREKAIESLEAYLKVDPDGAFAADAAYRIALCHQGIQKYEGVIDLCKSWRTRYGRHPLLGEVLALQGDAVAALRNPEEAAALYCEVLNAGANDEVLEYALFEANKHFQKLGRWDKTSELFKNFIETHPEHPGVVMAMYWLSRALVKEGKSHEAKRFLSEKIGSFIADRSRDSVEELLSQLAQLCAKRPSGFVSSVSKQNNVAAVTPGKGEDHTAFSPEAELDSLLLGCVPQEHALAHARLLFAQAELARFLRKTSTAMDLMDKVADATPAGSLSAALLARCGDRHLERGRIPDAKAFYDELMRGFPKSKFVDYAYNGRAQLCLMEGKFEDALLWFTDAFDKTGAPSKQKELTLGKGKTLMELGKYEDAKACLQQVASRREWRGESTAEAVLLMGEVHFRNGEYDIALQHFQRVFVAYQRYPAIVAKAYLRSADCFEALGDSAKAQSHLREFLANEKLASLPETAEARQRSQSYTQK